MLSITNVTRIVGLAAVLIFLTTAVRAQDTETHIKCPVTRESIIQLEWPRVTTSVIPDYPAIAAAQRVSGSVRVEVEIDSKGVVSSARVITGHKLLGAAALEASLRWKFQSPESVHSILLTFIFRDVDYVAPKEKPECGASPYSVEVLWASSH